MDEKERMRMDERRVMRGYEKGRKEGKERKESVDLDQLLFGNF